jgi:diguanylate cyclase (GGDEF)-like protein
MRTRAFTAYAIAMPVLIGAYLVTPDGHWIRPFWQVGVGWLAAACAVVGVRRHRPTAAAAWLLFAAGVFLNASGIGVEKLLTEVFHQDRYPSLADAFWLCLYPCLIGGLLLLIRSRSAGRDWSAVIDTTTLTTGLGLLSWVFVVRPTAGDSELSLFGHIVVAAYPVGDVVVLAMMTRILLSGGTRSIAFRCMVASLLAFLAGDVAWVVIFSIFPGWEPAGLWLHLVEMVFLVAYALVGAAALHPSVREVGRPVPVRQTELSPVLIAGLTAASLIAPVLLALQAVLGSVRDGVAIALSSTVLFLLVVTRMVGLVRRVESQSRQLRELAWVDELTGLANRRAWVAELPAAIERARRDGVPLSVALVDLDHFKRFNDTYGHQAGDQLLKAAASGWSECARTVDLLARYGGEEFIVLFPSTRAAAAAAVLDRMRQATPAGQTFSAGVATWNGAETSHELVARADAALYRAKHAGRNCTITADNSPAEPLQPVNGEMRAILSV